MSYFEVDDPVLQDAIDYINEYCIEEFGEPAIDDEDPNFRDIGLLYTFAGDNDEVVFEVSVDLDNCTMKCFVNGELRDTTEYADLQDMIDTDLSSLSFDALYHWCFTNTTDEDFDDDMLNFISEQASNYAAGKMMRDDSEVEIDEIDGKIWLCDYSESRGSSTPIKMLCDVDEVDVDELISLCDDNGWYCVL